MPDFEDDLCILISDVARHMRSYGNQLAHRHGMTFAQLTILERLEREPDISQSELAAITELSPMTVARLIDMVEARGLVERCADAQDRRLWRLRLTPAAAPLLRAIKSLRAKLFLVATRGINAAALGAITCSLQQMKDNVSNERLLKASA